MTTVRISTMWKHASVCSEGGSGFVLGSTIMDIVSDTVAKGIIIREVVVDEFDPEAIRDVDDDTKVELVRSLVQQMKRQVAEGKKWRDLYNEERDENSVLRKLAKEFEESTNCSIYKAFGNMTIRFGGDEGYW